MTVWKNEVITHPNELCQDTQLQIGQVKHLHRHLINCTSDEGVKGLTFDSDVECIPYDKICAIKSNYRIYYDTGANNYDYKKCPPLWRLLHSHYFCLNHTNFEGNRYCPEGHLKCKGNSPWKCYDPANQCKLSTNNCDCYDNSDYICDVDLNFDDFMKCKGDRHHFLCANGKQCIHFRLLCDGYAQCGDGSDEGDEQCGHCP